MKVRAIRPGYYGKLREVGEVFEVADGRKATWYETVGREPAAPASRPERAKGRAKGESSDDLV